MLHRFIKVVKGLTRTARIMEKSTPAPGFEPGYPCGNWLTQILFKTSAVPGCAMPAYVDFYIPGNSRY